MFSWPCTVTPEPSVSFMVLGNGPFTTCTHPWLPPVAPGKYDWLFRNAKKNVDLKESPYESSGIGLSSLPSSCSLTP